MSYPSSDISDDEEDHAMDNIRAMLQNYYGTEQTEEVKEEDYYDMDSKVFDKDKYIPKVLKEQSLPELIKTNIKVITEAKQLDSDMQKLVYENYSRFMTASKTVRTLQGNVGDMEKRMSSLMERIQTVSSTTNTIGSSLDANRTKVDKLVNVKRLLKKLQFLFDLPSRLQRCVELEAYDQAVDYYISSSQVLNDYRHIQSFNTIQESSDAIMSKLKTHMLLAIQEPGIRMTLLEDYVRLLMKLGHPVADLFTIYLNYHRDRLGGIIDKYQKLRALSDDEKEIIALSGSEEEVKELRAKQQATGAYPLMEFMGMLEKEFIDLLIHVTIAFKDIFQEDEASQVSLVAFVQDLMGKYLQAVTDRIKEDTSYEHVLEEDRMSPFGEIRSALDMLNLHVVKVDNIVPNTGIVPTMQTLLKNTVKTQMAGSFDVCRAELLALLQRQQEALLSPLVSQPLSLLLLPLSRLLSSLLFLLSPLLNPLLSLLLNSLLNSLWQSRRPRREQSNPLSLLLSLLNSPLNLLPPPLLTLLLSLLLNPLLNSPHLAPREVSAAVCTGVETLLHRVVERLNSLLSLVQAALPAAVAGFTEYFYMQIQQTLLWFLALLLKAQNAPHTLLYGPEKVLGAADPKLTPVVLNPALVAQLATLSLSPRLALALFAACRGLSKQAVKAVAQTLLDYTPEDPSVDQEALTLGLNLAGIVHACNATAAAMLRGFCVLLAKQCAALFVGGAVNGEGAEGFVADASLEVARLLYTAFEDCNEVVCDAAVALATGEAEALVHAEAKESEELYEYIEKSMSTRVKVVPAEIRATMADVMSCVLACFAKNVGEEIRANVMYDYQYRSVEVNLAFLLTMAKGVLKDTSAVKERFVDTLNSAFERCYEPGDMEEEVQKKEIVAAMEHFTELVTEK
ncbi:vacuolar protein sorting-associated protein [Blastocystis sp. ATCC 50177/Nand II]|uniref:Vacuolar protein sorting-associated protein 51 homolog n=1 Tax=Blastocystis sp. subtype 1 (strain ATCC 50177 / NandII) TaxID=478820 RepID=A0A196S950_BLAHN|nr:vacuolar protein sorting-associated protein [Blastocystis sp. ATCC 50177/Nand II]